MLVFLSKVRSGDRAWLVSYSYRDFLHLHTFLTDDFMSDSYMAEILPPFPSKPLASTREGKEQVKDGLQLYLTVLLGLELVRDESNAAMALVAFFQVSISQGSSSQELSDTVEILLY